MELGRKKCVNGSQLPPKMKTSIFMFHKSHRLFFCPTISFVCPADSWLEKMKELWWMGWMRGPDANRFVSLSFLEPWQGICHSAILSELLDNFKEILWSQNSWRCLYKPTQPTQRKQFSVKTCTFDAQPRAEHHHPDAVLKKLDQTGLGRSATWICPPCPTCPTCPTCPWLHVHEWEMLLGLGGKKEMALKKKEFSLRTNNNNNNGQRCSKRSSRT